MSSGVSLEERVDDIKLDQDDSNSDFEQQKPERKPETRTVIRLTEYGFKECSWQYYAARATIEALSDRSSKASMYIVGKMFDEMPKSYKKGKSKLAEEKLYDILRKLMEEGVLVKMGVIRGMIIWRGKNYPNVARGEGISFQTDIVDTRY